VNADLDIALKNKPEELQRLHQMIEEFVRQYKLSPQVRLAVGLSLEEHLTNIISYGYGDPAEHWISIRLRLTFAEVQIEVEDDGRPFNPLEAPPVDTSVPLDKKPLGGLGIHMIRKMMDTLDYRRQAGKNILVMKKRLA